MLHFSNTVVVVVVIVVVVVFVVHLNNIYEFIAANTLIEAAAAEAASASSKLCMIYATAQTIDKYHSDWPGGVWGEGEGEVRGVVKVRRTLELMSKSRSTS